MPAPAPSAPSSSTGAGLGPPRALARRAFRDARARTIAFAYLFAIYAYIQPVGYRHAYPTLADRLAFARSFAGNDALRLFYGYPHDLADGRRLQRLARRRDAGDRRRGLRAAGRGARAAGRGGHGPDGARAGRRASGGARRISRRWPRSRPASSILWLAEFAGFVVGGLPAGGSAYLALATRVGRAGVRGRGRAREPARADPPHRARARRRDRRRCSCCCA